MKKLILLITMNLWISQACLAGELDNKIEITITNIDKAKRGNLIVFIYKDDNFPSGEEKAIAIRTLKVHKTTQVVRFSNHDFPDELAFKVLHDEDANEKTTKNWTGLWPGEGLAFSNSQKLGFLGAPNFDEAKITKKKYSAGITLSLEYP